MRAALQQLKQEMFNDKYVLLLKKDEAVALRRTIAELHAEVNRLKELNEACQDVLQLKKDEAVTLRRSVADLHEEVNHLKEMYDACQDDMLDYEELTQSFEETKKELQRANLCMYQSSTREKLAQAKLQSCKAAMLNLSEQGARATIMWVEEVDRQKSLQSSAVADLQSAVDMNALGTCPACRCVPASKLKLFV
ncbi:hypothetical protein OEZ85_011049 [Tetradesmus obliquus]|uniref:EF-hand domain-containing protein n=1 Tax=Tetradesmus obliquus TaxID=3088 RepID=A0ABY8TR67_TETOB|nr:hypothetical protein OEZ85_011049 [Tetradesmus obliquus]